MDGQLWESHNRIMDRDLGGRKAPDRALNLKDIYVKMQACVFCACIFEGHVLK